MKGFKKLLTGILAATMVMGASITAFAANDASITIKPQETSTGEVQSIDYTYYQVLRASYEGEDTSVITYYLNNNTEEAALKDLLVATGKFKATPSADGSRFTMTSEETDGEAMRDAINTDAIKKAAIATGDFSYNKDTGKAESGNLDKGYYLVESSLGSVVALQTLGNEEITEKNTYITTDKTVAKTNYKVGDKVEYTATVYIPATTEVDSSVVLHDTMDQALTFNNDVASEGFTGFTVTEDPTDDCTFEVVIPVTKDVLNTTLTFTYSATLNEDAQGTDGFVNELFGENNGYKTKPTKPVVYTFSFDLLKTFQGTSGNEGYTADFEVRTAAGDATTAIAFKKVDANNYKKAQVASEGSTTVTVTQGVTSNFYGLDEGTYYLVETATDAQGFNILSEAVAVTITAGENGAYTVTYTVNGQQNDGTVTIENTSGQLLPSTGGIGTTIFYIVGAILIIAGIAYFIVRRKAQAE